jgi:hypothetical protein
LTIVTSSPARTGICTPFLAGTTNFTVFSMCTASQLEAMGGIMAVCSRLARETVAARGQEASLFRFINEELTV